MLLADHGKDRYLLATSPLKTCTVELKSEDNVEKLRKALQHVRLFEAYEAAQISAFAKDAGR